VLVNSQQLETIASRPAIVRPTYVSVRVESVEDDNAVVLVGVYPALRKGETALCCSAKTTLYALNRQGLWTFSRTLSSVIH
jgi:hypothetical protein